MQTPFTIIIPARYASTRLPGKPLLDINGKPLIQHVYETARQSQANQVYIATDDQRIAETAQAFGADVVMTSTGHHSGTDRLAEVVTLKHIGENEIIVNLQGDEFGLPAALLDQVAGCLDKYPDKQVATLCEEISDKEEYLSPDVVKVIFDQQHSAIYFSRSPIPANRQQADLPDKAYRHIGLYAYRAGYLKTFTQLAPCPLEQAEALEQLRILYYGGVIHVDTAVEKAGMGIDTMEDLNRARAAQ